MRKKVSLSVISLIIFISIGLFFTSCNLSDIIPDIDIGSIWEVFGYNKPANLKALTVSDSQIYLSWEDKVTGEDGFKIEVTDGDLNVTEISVEKNTTEYYHKPLNANMLYLYKMHAYDDTGKSEYSNIAFAKTDLGATVEPDVPTNLQAAPVSDTKIDLSWDDNSSNEDGFKVYRSTDDLIYTLIDTADPNVTSFTDTGLDQNTLYYYKLLAYNSFNTSDDDADAEGPASATTLLTPEFAPDAPTNLQAAAVSNMRIDLTWMDNSDNEEAFIVQISTNNSTFSTIGEVKPNVTTYQSTSLTPETTYYYQIYATNSKGDSAVTESAKARTLPTPGTVPEAPSNLQAKAVSDSQIAIGWTDNSVDEDGFNVFISKDEGSTYDWVDKVKPNVNEYLMSGLASGSPYYFKVSAFNFFGESEYSDAASATTLSVGGVPEMPSGLLAKTVSDTQIAIWWNDNSDNEEGFNIFISKDGDYFDWFTKVKPDTSEYIVGGLPSGHQFWFTVNAYNKYGASELPVSVSAWTGDTPSTAPAAPTNLVAKGASDTRIDMAWTDNSDNEDGFAVLISENGSTFYFLDKVKPDLSEYSLGGLKPNLTLYFRVFAFNSEGESELSNIAKATTLPEAGEVPADPTGLFANVVSHTQIALGWNDNSGDEDGFNIEWYVDKEHGETAPGEGDPGWEWFDTVPPDTKEYLAEGLYPDITFWFRVRAYNKIGPSLNYSNAAGGRTPVEPTGPPKAPTNLAARAVSDTVIELRWSDNSGDEDAFYIEIYKGVEEPLAEKFELYKKVAPNTTGFAVGGLVENTQYWFRVCAANIGGKTYTEEPATATATTNPASGDPPKEPTGLIAKVLSDTQIGLVWTDNSGDEDGFNIYKGLTLEEFVYDGQVGPGETKYIAEGLTEQTTYLFLVRAFNKAGESLESNIAEEKTLPTPEDAPAAPGGLEAATASDTVIELRWKDMSNNEDGFYIDRSTDGEKYERIDKLAAGSVYYAAKGLTPSTQYWFMVVSYNGEGEAASDPATATTNDPPSDIPSAPSDFTATTISEKIILLTWTDTPDNEDGFFIRRAQEDPRNPGNPGEYKLIKELNANETKIEIEGLEAGTPYWFLINAFNKFGDSPDIDPAFAITSESPEFPPNAPDGLTAEAIGDLTILLTWNDNSTVEESFMIQRGPNSTEFKDLVKVKAVAGTGEVQYEDGGLDHGVPYYYRVYASNGAGDSDPCTPASATAVKEIK